MLIILFFDFRLENAFYEIAQGYYTNEVRRVKAHKVTMKIVCTQFLFTDCISLSFSDWNVTYWLSKQIQPANKTCGPFPLRQRSIRALYLFNATSGRSKLLLKGNMV